MAVSSFYDSFSDPGKWDFTAELKGYISDDEDLPSASALSKEDQAFKDAAPKLVISKPDPVSRRVKDHSRTSFSSVSSSGPISSKSNELSRYARDFFQDLNLAYLERKKGNDAQAFQIMQPYYVSFFSESEQERMRGSEAHVIHSVIDRAGKVFWDEVEQGSMMYSERELEENLALDKRDLESIFAECTEHQINQFIREELLPHESFDNGLLGISKFSGLAGS